ncbi:MAG: DUF4350 domain-containing protein [Chloroflexi bacterium]|nr:MAG: hypothetical protein AUH32_05145 [Actinobacteria bacterium 13_1_40CM_66_12]TMF47134.1 MAG: DUF4350 domain-containing protein [Chloroflexota bacterium]
MRGLRGWILALALALLIGAVAYLGQPKQDSPEHSSSSDAANGTSAARLFAQAMGHSTNQIEGSFSPPSANSLMFVFTPTSPFTTDDANQTANWVRLGGVIVYASEQGDPELDRALSVNRINGFVSGSTQLADPVLDGVTTVSGGNTAMPFDASPVQVPILRSRDGFPLGYLQKFGLGTVLVLADPLVLCNGYLDKTDNGRLLSDILGLVDGKAAIGFDEYHHGLILSDLAPQAWVTTPWGAAILWLLAAVFVGLLLRGRRFGPLIPRPAEAARADAEWAVAVGELLRRSGARALTLGMLAAASERAVAARTGLPAQPRDRFWNALYTRAPELAVELADAELALQSSTGGEAELLSAAQKLHRIAYPPARERRGQPT